MLVGILLDKLTSVGEFAHPAIAVTLGFEIDQLILVHFKDVGVLSVVCGKNQPIVLDLIGAENEVRTEIIKTKMETITLE